MLHEVQIDGQADVTVNTIKFTCWWHWEILKAI